MAGHREIYVLKKLVRLGCITQGSFAEVTNQRFFLKYQTLTHAHSVSHYH